MEPVITEPERPAAWHPTALAQCLAERIVEPGGPLDLLSAPLRCGRDLAST